jgi:hypothetical protein
LSNKIRLFDGACAHQCRNDISGHTDISSASVDDNVSRVPTSASIAIGTDEEDMDERQGGMACGKKDWVKARHAAPTAILGPGLDVVLT